MGMLNNLRRCIVKRLIRQEDGYVFMGMRNGEPIKFCYNKKTGKYILSMWDENGHYFEPTLTGWNPVLTCKSELDEIDFQKWIHGVLDNVCNQYFERLDGLSTRDIKHLSDYKNGETGDGFVINKQSFCEIMDGLEKFWDSMRKLEDILNVYFEDNMMTDVFNTVVNALEEDLDPNPDLSESPIIYSWLFDTDRASASIDGHPLTTAEELYDYLVWKRDAAENSHD